MKQITKNWEQFLKEGTFFATSAAQDPIMPPFETEISPCGAKKNTDKEELTAHHNEEGKMYRTQLAHLISDATMLLDLFDDSTDIPEHLKVKIIKASDYILSATRYLAGQKSREEGRLSDEV